MKNYKIIKISDKTYKYNVQFLIDGNYCGIGMFCKNYFGVLIFILKNNHIQKKIRRQRLKK